MLQAEEHELVPYSPGFPPGSRWLVLAPHPDDETFGMGATLAQAAQQGVCVRVVALTDGGAQGETHVRREEMRAALRTLGVSEPVFLGFEDRTLEDCRPAVSRALGREVLDFSPEVVFTPHPADLHPDHRACTRALQLGLRRLWLSSFGRRFPRWVVFYEVGIPLWPSLLVRADDGWEAKARAFTCYASQLAARPYHRLMTGLAAFRALTLDHAQYAEAFQVHTAHRVAWRSSRSLVRQALGPQRLACSRGVAP